MTLENQIKRYRELTREAYDVIGYVANKERDNYNALYEIHYTHEMYCFTYDILLEGYISLKNK